MATYNSTFSGTQIDANLTLAADALPKSGGTMTGNIALGDNDKVKLGAGDDLQIYHDGSNSHIKNTGSLFVASQTSGDLYLRSDDDIFIQGQGGENSITVTGNAGITLYHDNSEKIATTSTGVDVTGTVTADGLTVQTTNGLDAVLESSNSYQYLQFKTSAEDNNYLGFVGADFTVTAANKKYLQVENGGDVSFYEDTGTTPKFFWDASAESLGIGTSSPTTKIHVKSDSNDSLVNTIGLSPSTTDNIQGGLGVVAGGQVSINGANIVTATTAGTERLRIDSSGQVGIGTASPSGLLQIYESGTSAYKTYTATGTGAILQSYQSQGSPYTKTTDLVAGSDGTVPSEIRMHTRTAGSSSVDERMRIDSSGNVGVGATAPATTLDVRSTDPVIRLKATGGTADKNTYELRTIGAAGFEGFAIRSRNDSGSVADTHIQIVDGGNVGIGTTTPSAALDVIGDIEVSGGVYLGGTAAANKLDDYETGTWTPTFTGASGVALYGVQQGKYTKVGNTVTVTGELQAKRNTLSGDITLTGLPFSASGSNAGVTFGFVMRTLTDMPNLKGYIGGSVINIRDQATNATGSTSVTETDLKDTATTDNYIYFSATYLAA